MTFHGRSGLHLEAWVRIQLLTESFCDKLRSVQMDDPKENLLSIDFGVIRSQEQDIVQRQAMDNIIMNCQKNYSKAKRIANGPAQFANIIQYLR